MKLADVIDSIYVKHVAGTLEVDVTGVYYDSRQVKPGGIFCALKGGGRDGHDYLDAAIENGAVAIISEQPNPAAFVATWLGQALGWYSAGQGAGFIGATVGAVILLALWGVISKQRSA